MKSKRRLKVKLKDKNLTLWPEDATRDLPDDYADLQNLNEDVAGQPRKAGL